METTRVVPWPASLFAALALAPLGCGDVVTEPAPEPAPYEPFPASCSEVPTAGVCDGESKVCGNGARDTCEICYSSDGGPITCEDVTEACDGAATESCVSLGYGAGEVRCSPLCTHDVRDCDACLGAPSQVACTRPRVDAFDVGDVALAASDDVLAAAWMSFDDVLHFARFSPELALLGERPGCTLEERSLPVALAPTPGGWVLAVGQGGDAPALRLYRLDPEGNPLAAARVVANATFPQLVARPGAPPWLVYLQTDFAAGLGVVVAEGLDEAGEATFSVPLVDEVFGEYTRAAYAEPGFVVTARRTDGVDPTTVLVGVSEDGVAGAPRDVGDALEVELAPAGPDRVAALYRTETQHELLWLDGQGADRSGPFAIAPRDPTGAVQAHRVVVQDGRAIVAVAEETYTKLRLVHVGEDGATLVPGYLFAAEPDHFAWLRSTSFQGEAALLWTTYSADPATNRFVLGRVRP